MMINNKLLKARIFDIQKNSVVDGPGIRTAVFFKGCNLRCKWCHNPEGLIKAKQKMFFQERCTDCGMCKKVCASSFNSCDLCGKCAYYCLSGARRICGKDYTIEEIYSEIVKDKEFYNVSGGGITFTGGECMLQLDFLVELLKTCKKSGIHTAVDTAGNVPFENFEKILPYTDLILYDVKCITEDLHVSGTGVSNNLILNNLK